MVTAMREAMDCPDCLFEEKWRAGKELREGHVVELRLLRELVTMDSPLIRKHGRLLAAGSEAGQQDGYCPAALAATGVDRHEGASPDHVPALRRDAYVGGHGLGAVRGQHYGPQRRPEDASCHFREACCPERDDRLVRCAVRPGPSGER